MKPVPAQSRTPTVPSDAAARAFATDPTQNVVLEASAGTGKTSVLVARYVNLLRAGVDPANILAITFTRQAAAEMQQRIIGQLRADATQTPEAEARWRNLHDRFGEIAISTIDAFCLSLLLEFPLESDLDPGFGMVDETEVPHLIKDAVERTLTVGAEMACRDTDVAMLLAQLGPWRARAAFSHLLRRRLVVPVALHRFLNAAPLNLTGERACRLAAKRLAEQLAGMRREVEHLMAAGPHEEQRFALISRDLKQLHELADAEPARIRAALDRFREFFLTKKGTARTVFRQSQRGADQSKRQCYRDAAVALAPFVCETLRAFDRDLNVAMARGVQRLFGVAISEYQRALDARTVVDFSDVLRRAVDLLSRMDEFSRSRYRLESRYHHVLVDEFQDTSRSQWKLVSLLVKSWGEGSGLGSEAPLPPSIFIVGDRKQSIYRFRDADPTVLQDAADEIANLREDGDARLSIVHSFRAVPELLRFVNDLFADVKKSPARLDAFRYDKGDRFPLERLATKGQCNDLEVPLGVVVGHNVERCAERVAVEIARLLEDSTVRDQECGIRRNVRFSDIGILFRARESHKEFELALERRGIQTCVYKGLGFFDADEIKDLRALLRFLARPWSELRAASVMRSRFVRVSDRGLLTLSPHLSAALVGYEVPSAIESLEDDDRRVVELMRNSLVRWLGLVDRLPPAEVLDILLSEGAYAFELRGPHRVQARENVKKLRALVRRLQNRGCATMARVADHIDHLSGDMSNATVDAFDAVNLMTVHASKGLEFPIVFLVDLGRGTGAQPPAIRIVSDRGDGHPSVTIWPFRSEVDKDERNRELEETKRLLYVASTRARDRLYLSTVLEENGPKFNRGSLGEVLPNLFGPVFKAAARAQTGKLVRWQGLNGSDHAFRVCGSPPAPEQSQRNEHSRPDASTNAPGPAPVVDRFEHLSDRPRLKRTSVTTMTEDQMDSSDAGQTEEDVERRLIIGLLLRQLLQRHVVQLLEPGAAYRETLALCQFLKLPNNDTTKNAADTAVTLYTRITEGSDLAALVAGECLFEVPFSFHSPTTRLPDKPQQIIRGTIYCLARSSTGKVTVVDFKTGRPKPEHRYQLDLYTAAGQAMFPQVDVQGRLIYTDGQVFSSVRLNRQ